MCEGTCQVQFYDVDVSEVVVTPDANNPKDCPAAPTPEEIADVLQSYFATVGCKEPDCECILFYPTDAATPFTPWQAYDVPAGKEIVVVRPDFSTCKYALSGTYYVSSGIKDGLCMKKPKDFPGHPRKKNPKPRPKKSDKPEGGEKKKEKPKKKAGHKRTGRRVRF